MRGSGTQDKPYKISPSSLGNFVDCPCCFVTHDLKVAKKPSAPFAQLPNGIDDSMRAAMTVAYTSGVMPAEFAAVPELADCTLADRSFMTKEQILDVSDQHVITTGEEFTLTGKLDELFVANDGAFVIADYKTKRSLNHASKDAHPAYVRQLRCYAYILRSNGHTVRDTALLLNYYPTGTSFVNEVHPYLEFLVDRVDVSVAATAPVVQAWKDMAETWHMHKAAGTTPARDPDCTWCDYRRP